MSVAAAILGFCGVMVWRVREGRSPVTVRKIVIPPLGMSTGFCMFIVPAFRVPWLWALAAFAIGALVLAYPLIRTSRLDWHHDGETIMMRRSAAFFIVVVVLAVIRFAAKGYLDRYISLEQTAGLFFILAFGMILRWRLSMLMEYRRIVATPPQPTATPAR
jgi:membrane protein CcdC involved in cytochrome C biogenesis